MRPVLLLLLDGPLRVDGFRGDGGHASPDGTRWTHPLPSSVGEAYRGDRSHALADETWTSTERGSLGPSVRTIAPVRDEDGAVVALVATGVLLEAVSQQALAQLPAVLLVGLLLLTASATVAALWARYLGRVIHGWGPEELGVSTTPAARRDAVWACTWCGRSSTGGARGSGTTTTPGPCSP